MSVLLSVMELNGITKNASDFGNKNLRNGISSNLICSNDYLASHSCETSEVMSSTGENTLSNITSLDELEEASSSWTEFEHESYLDTMETNFVQNMYTNKFCESKLCGICGSLEQLSSLEPETRTFYLDNQFYADNFLSPDSRHPSTCLKECSNTKINYGDKEENSNFMNCSFSHSHSNLLNSSNSQLQLYQNLNGIEIKDELDSTLKKKERKSNSNTKSPSNHSYLHQCRQHKCAKTVGRGKKLRKSL